MPIASKPRARLSEAQVRTIFQAKATGATSTKIATDFGMSETAVRDIWSGRTWSRETWHLDPSRPFQLKLSLRTKGCKTRNPKKKCALQFDELTACSTLSAQVSSCSYDNQYASPNHNQYDSHNIEGQIFMPTTLQMPLKQPANQGFLPKHCKVTVSDSNAWHQSEEAWLISSTVTLRRACVDDQLHDWDTFWRVAANADPFCGNWESF
jgi:hypothetical protein